MAVKWVPAIMLAATAVFFLPLAALSADASDYEKFERAAEEKGREVSKILARDVRGISADRLISAYKANSVNADAVLKGELLCVSGLVRKVDRQLDGRPVVILEPFNDKLWPGEVLCIYDKGYDRVVVKLQPSDVVSVLGKCTGDGFIGDVLLEGCGPPYEEYTKKLAKVREKQAAENAKLAEQREKELDEFYRRKKEEKLKRRPAVAAGLLKSAKSLKDAGKDDAYEKWLHKVIDRYPETPAAKEAEQLLAEE